METILTRQALRLSDRLSCSGSALEPLTWSQAINDDSEIIARVVAGDRNLFGDLVKRHQGRVYRVALAILSDPHEAEEASQDAFLRAYQALPKFRGDAAFSTWLTRIAINTSRSRLRRLKARQWFSLEALREKGDFVEPTAPSDDPQTAARALLAGLPEGDREILLLKEVEGMDYAGIAASMGISVEAVRGRLKRARVRLRHETADNDVQ